MMIEDVFPERGGPRTSTELSGAAHMRSVRRRHRDRSLLRVRARWRGRPPTGRRGRSRRHLACATRSVDERRGEHVDPAIAGVTRAPDGTSESRRERSECREHRGTGAGRDRRSQGVGLCRHGVRGARSHVPDVGSERDRQFESEVGSFGLLGFDDDCVVRSVGQTLP